MWILSYLKAVLETLRVGPNMLTWIMALYSIPSAKVKVNGVFFIWITHQEWHETEVSHSPLLFALALELLLCTVRENPDISGLTVGSTEHKLSAYADDILFYLTHPLVSLPNLMQEL